MKNFEVPAAYAARYPHLEALRVAMRAGVAEAEVHAMAVRLMVFNTSKAK